MKTETAAAIKANEGDGAQWDYGLKCAPDLIEVQARRAPDAVALICEGERVTYGSLNARVNCLAHTLEARGVVPNVMVGLHLERSIDGIVGLLGILKSGGAYVPLDPGYPEERIKFIIQNSAMRLILAGTRLSHAIRSDGTEIVVVEPPEDEQVSTNFSSRATLDAAAYVCYTSGSTGLPKGIVHTHRHLVHRIPFLLESDVCALNTSLSFAFSLVRLFPPLFHGGTLVVIPDAKVHNIMQLVDTIESEQITNIGIVPSALRQLLDLRSSVHSRLRSLHSVTVSGAALSEELISRFMAVLPQAKLFYGYGSSETGPVTIREVTSDQDPDPSFVGPVLANTQIRIMDKDMKIVPQGEVGELCVGSLHLAREYLNQPELTNDRFVPNPCATPWFGGRLFRTGDLARWLPNGRLQLVGRIDHQLKIRGFRVEPAEIERVLQAYPGIEQVVVTGQNAGGETRLVAFLITSTTNTPRVSELRNHILRSLPDYMVPAVFIILDALPLSSNGKLDRSALPQHDPRRLELDSPYQAPRDKVEAALAALWSETLEVQRVGIHDHFLELGADSLTATRLAAGIVDRLGVEVPLLSLFERPTIAELASEISHQLGLAETSVSDAAQSRR